MIKDKSIFIKNIYYMLAYAFTNLKRTEIDKFAAEEFKNIHDLLAAILSKGIAKQLKQGLYREYVNKTENLATLRGKIEMDGTIKNIFSGKKFLSCNYDELSENNLPNQILKTTVNLLLRNENVSDKNKSALKKAILFFANVDEILPQFVRREKIFLPRNNQNYQMLINICLLILEGMLLTTESGELKLAKFLDEKNFCYLYERFLLEFFKKECPKVTAKAEKISWAAEDCDKKFLPTMKTDITLSQENNFLIIDAKYYSETLKTYHDTKKISSSNLYQIFAYVKNFEFNTSKKVSGMLLYARTDEEIQPDNIYKICGNKISVKTLDLNKNFSEIEQNLKFIVKDHFVS